MSILLDNKPPIIPANTSPLPAVANHLAPAVFTKALLFGEAIIVVAPFSTTIAFNILAAFKALLIKFPVRLGNIDLSSPSCGVIITSFPESIFTNISNLFLKHDMAPASKTILLFVLRADLIFNIDLLLISSPGPITMESILDSLIIVLYSLIFLYVFTN